MLIVTGTFDLEPDHVGRLKAAAIEMARATRTEPGCVVYAFWQDIEDDARFRVYEEWESQAHLAAHFETPHMQVWRAELAKGGIRDRAICKIENAEPVAL